jgi:hypothetical protein
MIKATGVTKDGSTLILLGLEAGNLVKLREGKPIKVRSEDLKLEGNFEILICYEDTTDKLLEKLMPYVDSTSKLHVDIPVTALGATGEYPHGKLNADDEGALRVAVGVDQGVVKVMFGKPTAWIGMPKKHALALADSIRQQAEALPEEQ